MRIVNTGSLCQAAQEDGQVAEPPTAARADEGGRAQKRGQTSPCADGTGCNTGDP